MDGLLRGDAAGARFIEGAWPCNSQKNACGHPTRRSVRVDSGPGRPYSGPKAGHRWAGHQKPGGIAVDASQISNPSDRRDGARRPFRGRVVLRFAGAQQLECRGWDLSTGGMSVISPYNLPPGLHFDVVFALTKDGQNIPIEAGVQVQYSSFASDQDGFRVGLMFKRISESSAATVNKWVSA